MISFSEAMSIIKAHAYSNNYIKIKSEEALGAYLAHDIPAPLDLPPFDNSAVDGFAVCASDIQIGEKILLAHTIRAQAQSSYSLSAKSSAKIMTGAPLPKDADAVIMKEDAREEASHVIFSCLPTVHAHIRKQGEDIKKGAILALKNQLVTPQLLGLLLASGLDSIEIRKKPKLVIICTGDELVKAPQELKFGEVYFFVGPMLKAQAQQIGIEEIHIEHVFDNLSEIEQSIERAFDADLVLITGGMSKGEHDLVRQALARLGVQEIFYQGLWRPGKPLYFGRKNKCYFFGLPGNPVASFVCFRIFVQTWLQEHELKYATLANNFTKSAHVSFFARAYFRPDSSLAILPAQGSHEIFTLSKAQALCYLPENMSNFTQGMTVGYWSI